MATFPDYADARRWSTLTLAPGQATVIRQTYLLLALSALAALAGGYVGATSPLLVGLFSSWMGWILAMVILNLMPVLAMSLRHSGGLGILALAGEGFVSGLVLAPILAIAATVAPDIILSALIVTALVFFAVTFYIFFTKRTFSPRTGIMAGIFVSLIAASLLNGFLRLGVLGIAISAGIGIFGVLSLVYSTSQVLQSPDADSPIPGALMLFAGLFNVFVATLSLLLNFGRSRD